MSMFVFPLTGLIFLVYFNQINAYCSGRMVLYFTSSVVDPPAVIYMGDDKEENEKLIRWGWPEDVWFHVDKLSSAHVYLRLPPNQTIDDISENKLLQDCCQLVKANSIEGCKLSSTEVVYTSWSNLKKTGDMVTGQVGFHNDKAVKKVRVERQKEIVNRLNRTKVVKSDVDFQQLKEQRDAEERWKLKEQQRMDRKLAEVESERREREKEARSYERVFKAVRGTTNKDGVDLEEDFM